MPAAFAAGEGQYFGELAKVEISLGNSSRESFYLQAGGDLWIRELESLKRDISEFELQTGFVYNNPSLAP